MTIHKQLPREEFSCAVMSSPIGKLALVASQKGLVAIEFSARPPRMFRGVSTRMNPSDPTIQRAMTQLNEYFAGQRTRFNVPLDLRGTDFQKSAWRSLATIRFGRTISYAEEAALIGRPTAVRAVGSANGKNPLPIILPCHRVVASDGSLGGYSAGLAKKKWLLAHEGAPLASFVE